MPVAFLAPVFLAGLAALAIPVLIHLAKRPKTQVVRFPSLMFLEKVEYQASSRRRLRHVFLLALRCVALVLVAAAFARPFVQRPDAAPVPVDGGREVVVLVDRSASMGVGDRIERAREEVARVAAGLRRGDRATLVTFDHGAAAAHRATDDAAVLRSAADTLVAGDGGTRFGPGLRLAESLLSGSPLPRRELVVISDLQRRGWEAEAPVPAPAGTAVRVVAVGAATANAAVVDGAVARERFSGRDRARITATIMARGADFDGPVTLELDGREVQARALRVTAGSAGRVGFDPVTLPDRPVRAVVRIPADAMIADDALHLVLRGERPLRIVVAGDRGTDARAGLYLRRALEVGADRDLAVIPVSALAGALDGADVVILNDTDPADAEAERLRARVEAGAGAVIVLGERSRGRAAEALGLGRLTGTRDRSGDGGGALARVDALHPVFQPFRDGSAGQLAGARFYRYRQLEAAPEARVLARYDDGAPALVERTLGAGRVLALTAPLDGRWSDLVLQPVFVPLVDRLAVRASGRAPAPAWRRVGDLLEVASLPGAGARPAAEAAGAAGQEGAEPVIRTPTGRRIPVETGERVVRLDERGFYEVRDPRAAEVATVVAVNVDPAESDLAPADAGEVEAALGAGGVAAVPLSAAPVDRERRQSLWWWVLVAAFVVVAVETVVGNVLSRRAARVV